MEDNKIYDKINLIDRYELTCVKNELELSINIINDKIKEIEEQVINNAVNIEVNKEKQIKDLQQASNDSLRLDKMVLNSTRRIELKQKEINEALHINLMCLESDYIKCKEDINDREKLYRFYILLLLFLNLFIFFVK